MKFKFPIRFSQKQNYYSQTNRSFLTIRQPFAFCTEQTQNCNSPQDEGNKKNNHAEVRNVMSLLALTRLATKVRFEMCSIRGL